MKDTILSSLITGLVGLIIGNRIQLGKEAAGRRRAFRDVLACLREEVLSSFRDDLWRVHASTSDKLKTAALKVSEDIHFWKRWRFERAWRAYSDQTTKNFKNTNPARVKMANDLGIKSELVKDQMVRELDRVKKCAQ